MTNNILDNWKLLGAKRITEVDAQAAFPLLRWSSANVDNLDNCVKIDELFYKVPAKVIISLLAVSCRTGFYKYPKATKEAETDKQEIIKKYMCQYYKWSNAEFEKNKSLFTFVDVTDFIVTHCAPDKKDCKILGVEYGTTRKYKFTDKPRSAGLSAFM